MARAIGFKQDEELEEEEDYGYGTFSFDDGTTRYGYDPDLASEVGAYKSPEEERLESRVNSMPDERLAANDQTPSIEEQRAALDNYFATGEAPQPRADVEASTQPHKSTTPEQTTTPTPPTRERPKPQDAAREAITQHADGLDPDKLSRIISFETAGTFSPSIANPNGVHAGLIQFSKEHWPGVAKAAGQPDLSWDEMRKLSVAEQMPFVTSYLKERGITEKSSLGDYYLAVAAPGLMDAPDDKVAYKKGSKAVEQNSSWDRNKDGQVTAGELREVGESLGQARAKAAGFNMIRDAQANGPVDPDAPITEARAQAQAGGQGGMQLPQIPGMTPSKVSMQGTPLSPEQLEQRQLALRDQAVGMQAANTAGSQKIIAAKLAKQNEINQLAETKEKASIAARDKSVKAREQAQTEIDRAVKKPISEVDPKKYIKSMSTSDKVLGAISLILAGIGESWGAAIQGRAAGPNRALQIMLEGITEDIDAQKENIRTEKDEKSNRVAHWTRQLGDAKSGELAADAEATEAARLRLASHDISGESAEVQAQVEQANMALMERYQTSLQALEDNRANAIRIEYEAPVAAKPMSYAEQLEEERARRALGGATGGANPEIAPVGTEDESPESRATIADAFDAKNPAHKGQLDGLGKEMGQVTKLEKNLAKLETLYGVRADESGDYPAYDGNEDGYSSTATGPWYNVLDALDPDETRDRELKDAWAMVETGTREGWKTEPNGEVKQAELSGIDKAKRDSDVPTKLKELRMEIERRKEAIMSSTVAPVRAAWKLQNEYPLAGREGSQAVKGKVPVDDDDGLTTSGGW